jgi:nuclear cap-binding protein subunit 2
MLQVFSMVGPISKVIMGLNKVTRKPCGFAFVIYFSHQAAQCAASYITGTKLDNRYIRVDVDWGFQPDRQFGRGKTGGQVWQPQSWLT